MNTAQNWIAAMVAVVALAALIMVVARRTRRDNKLASVFGGLTRLTYVACGVTFAGLFLGDINPLIGFGLIGMGVILEGIDLFNASRAANKTM